MPSSGTLLDGANAFEMGSTWSGWWQGAQVPLSDFRWFICANDRSHDPETGDPDPTKCGQIMVYADNFQWFNGASPKLLLPSAAHYCTDSGSGFCLRNSEVFSAFGVDPPDGIDRWIDPVFVPAHWACHYDETGWHYVCNWVDDDWIPGSWVSNAWLEVSYYRGSEFVRQSLNGCTHSEFVSDPSNCSL